MMVVDELGPELAAWVRDLVRALLSDNPGWTESELSQVIMRARDVALTHPTVLRALEETDLQSGRRMVEADASAVKAMRLAALAPMLLEVAREH